VTVHRRRSSSSSSLSRKPSREKTKTASNVDLTDAGKAGNTAKPKKKKFSILSLALKSLSPKKAVGAAGNARVTAH